MSYTFQHIAKDRHNKEALDVTLKVAEQHCTTAEIVENFVYFLQGCGFVRESILRAMEEATEELEPQKDEEA